MHGCRLDLQGTHNERCGIQTYVKVDENSPSGIRSLGERTLLDIRSPTPWDCVCFMREHHYWFNGFNGTNAGMHMDSSIRRIKHGVMAYFEETPQEALLIATSTTGNALSPTPSQRVYLSASTFGMQYAPPVPDLSIQHNVEVLVEGNDMSQRRGVFCSRCTHVTG